MATGPGKYGADCTEIVDRYQADGALLCVIGGTKGEGFSVVGHNAVDIRMMAAVLEYVLEQLNKDIARLGTQGEA